jgi:ATP-dependent Zn protease
MIDYEVRAIIESRMAEVLALIKDKEKLLREIAGRLLEKETIEAEEFEEIIARESDRKAQVQ